MAFGVYQNRHPMKDTYMPQPPGFDKQWPFDETVLTSPMPHPYKMKLDPPFFGMRRVHFRSAAATTGFGTISRPQSRTRPPPGFFLQREAWKLQNFQEMRFWNGFSQVIPNGMEKVRIPRTSCDAYDQPVCHLLPYRHRDEPLNNLHAPPNRFEASFNSDNALSNENIASSRSTYIISKGHNEDLLTENAHSCEEMNVNRGQRQDRERMRTHQLPFCDVNKNVNVHIGHQNLRQKTLEDEVPMISSYTVVFNTQETDDQLNKHIQQLHHDCGSRHMGKRDINSLRLGSGELGIMKLDSSVEMSMSRKARNLMDDEYHPYLRESELYHSRHEQFDAEGIIGPPLNSPTQNFRYFWDLNE